MAITVEDLYAGLLGRTPDVGGLAYWNSIFGPTVEPAEVEQFRIAAAPEISRQQQAAYEQELAAANVQRVTPGQEVLTAIGSAPAPVIPPPPPPPPPSTSVAAPTPAPVTVTDLYRQFLGRDPSAADLAYWNQTFGPTIDATELGQFQLAAQPELESRPLLQIQSLLDAPQTGSGKSSGPAYDLNQQVLQMDKFRLQLREAYNNPALINQIAQQVSDSNLTQEHKNLVNEFVNDARNRIADNPNALTGSYVSNAAKSLDDAFGGVLGFNQANILSLDYTPAEVLEAVNVYRNSAERLLPEDALRVARDFDSTDSANLGKALRTSQNSQGQEGLLGSTFGITQAIARYNPATDSFTPDQGGAAKDVFAAQFNANLGIGSSRETTEGMTSVGEGFFTQKLGNPGAYDLFAVYYQDPTTGRAVQVGTSTNFNPELSGFRKFLGSTLGQIIIGVGTGLLLPGAASAVGGLLGTGTVASSAIAGSLLGLASSAITGGDLLTGALFGAAGGAFSGYVGTQGGLGNVIKSSGFNISDDLAATLNRYVSGNTVASADDIAAARSAVNAAAAAGTIDDATAAVARESIGNIADESLALGRAGFRLTPNQIEDFIPTPVGGGTLPRVPVPVPGSGLGPGIGMGGTGVGINPNAPGIGFNVNPEDFIPTPIGGGTLPPVTGVNTVIDTRLPPPIGGGTLPPITPAPNVQPIGGGGLGTTISGITDDIVGFVRRNPLEAAAVAASIASQPPQAQVIDTSLPAFVYDPAQSAVLPRIQAINNAQTPIFAPNFSNLFQRGGLGAGQYLGYGLLPRAGNIPAQTLLGVPTLAVNNIGVPIGQGSVGQAALI